MNNSMKVDAVRELLLELPHITKGTSYGFPSFLLNGKFFARFRDDDTVLALKVSSIAERDFLLQADPKAFFITEHYKNFPSILIRLSATKAPLLKSVLVEAHAAASAKPKARRKLPRRR